MIPFVFMAKRAQHRVPHDHRDNAPDPAKTPGQAVRAFVHTFGIQPQLRESTGASGGFGVWWLCPLHRPEGFTGSPALGGLHYAVAYPQGKPPVRWAAPKGIKQWQPELCPR